MWLLIKQTQNFKWKYDINIKRRYEQNLFLKKKNEQGHLVKPLIHNKHTSEHYFGRDFHLVRYLLLAYVWVNLSMYMLPFKELETLIVKCQFMAQIVGEKCWFIITGLWMERRMFHHTLYSWIVLYILDTMSLKWNIFWSSLFFMDLDKFHKKQNRKKY